MRTIINLDKNLNLMLATAPKRTLKSLRHPRLIWAGFALAVRVAGAGLIVLIGTNAWGGFTQ